MSEPLREPVETRDLVWDLPAGWTSLIDTNGSTISVAGGVDGVGNQLELETSGLASVTGGDVMVQSLELDTNGSIELGAAIYADAFDFGNDVTLVGDTALVSTSGGNQLWDVAFDGGFDLYVDAGGGERLGKNY